MAAFFNSTFLLALGISILMRGIEKFINLEGILIYIDETGKKEDDAASLLRDPLIARF